MPYAPQQAFEPYSATPTADLRRSGFHRFAAGVDARAASRLLRLLRETRDFGRCLFLTEEEFDADPQYKGVNPRPGRNILERFEDELGFVESDGAIVSALNEVLGVDYEIVLKKLICGVPATDIPPWVQDRITGNPVNNLGAYVRPEYRDVTYFYGIDFHQDLIDHPEREADFLTLYVYLHDVGENDAPLFLLPGSHLLGGTIFPHDLIKDGERWLYRDDRGGEVICPQLRLTGPTGLAAMWHACTLHGTQPDAATSARLSLRYLFGKRPGTSGVGIDRVNASLKGPLSMAATRRDLDARGAAAVKASAVSAA